MFSTFLLAVAFLLAGVALLSVGIWIRKNGRFPNIHVGKNPAMRKRGIGCVETQDAQAQRTNPMAVSEKSKNK
ncbi:MAG: tetraspanin family protein [Bacteroidaceae bacterium]|nr:tetraspanin family protein [Bacteroidaceae bacterium]